MKRTEYFSVPAGLIAAFVLASAHGTALAQAANDTKSLSGKAGTGKVMTRDELRACLSQQATLADRKTQLETRQNALMAERADIDKETTELNAEQEALAKRASAAEDLKARMKAFGDKVKDLQQRQDDFERSGRTGPSADRERRKLEKETADAKKEEADLNAERERMQSGGAEAVARLRARAEAQQQHAQAWNDKNKQLTADQQAHEDDRFAWIDNCGNRRYREDDEKAIKAGR